MRFFLIILLVTNLYKCENAPYKRYSVDLKNDAEYSIGFYFALGGNYGTLYPDTLLPTTNQYIIKEIKRDSRYIYDSGIKWEEIYSQFPKDTLSIYIFHTDTLNQYTWEEVRDNYLILNRYDLSLDDLTKLNNKYSVPEIPYPPNERMKNMKIYPPYGNE